MTAHELATLMIPDPFRTSEGYRFSTLESLGILCACFRSAGDQHDIALKYNRLQSAISGVVNELVEFLDATWSHLLDFDYEGILSCEKMAYYGDARGMQQLTYG